MRLREFFAEDAINLQLQSTAKDDVLKELVGLLKLDDKSEQTLVKMLKRRETLGSTGIGQNIAILLLPDRGPAPGGFQPVSACPREDRAVREGAGRAGEAGGRGDGEGILEAIGRQEYLGAARPEGRCRFPKMRCRVLRREIVV